MAVPLGSGKAMVRIFYCVLWSKETFRTDRCVLLPLVADGNPVVSFSVTVMGKTPPPEAPPAPGLESPAALLPSGVTPRELSALLESLCPCL